ncbi:MAG: hypothetical protein ACD_4C00189G0006 [uncultured bacterium (gcode 4)]|uniref:Radical SAM protein n=1 Tax=uncultured bacterium (gcode 4) TaxID=1234023 RepID=K2GTN0_9BACT|nr:MAG: hypothetical protein ACD_4C00189G0006 [uncultured bacterium (gcode 4)]
MKNNNFVENQDNSTLIDEINTCAGYNIASKMWIEKHKEDVLLSIIDLMYKKVAFSNKISYSKMIEEEQMSLEINLWKKCFHNCSHCLYDFDWMWDNLNYDHFIAAIKKYASKLKYVKEVFFTGWELMDREDFILFIEEFAKRWIKKINFVTRWGVIRNDFNLNELLKLKNKFPELDLSFSISLDQFSAVYDSNKELEIENISKLINLSFNLWNERILFKSTIPYKDEIEMKNHFDMNCHDFEKILSFLIKQFEFILLEKSKDTFVLKKDKRIITLKLTSQELTGYTKNSKNLKWVSLEANWNDYCEYLDFDANFSMTIDPSLNVLYCSHVNHWENCDKSIWNLLTDNRSELLQKFFNTKSRFYQLLSFEWIVDYILDPNWKMLCSNLRKELYIKK